MRERTLPAALHSVCFWQCLSSVLRALLSPNRVRRGTVREGFVKNNRRVRKAAYGTDAYEDTVLGRRSVSVTASLHRFDHLFHASGEGKCEAEASPSALGGNRRLVATAPLADRQLPTEPTELIATASLHEGDIAANGRIESSARGRRFRFRSKDPGGNSPSSLRHRRGGAMHESAHKNVLLRFFCGGLVPPS